MEDAQLPSLCPKRSGLICIADVSSFADWIVHRRPAPIVCRHGPLAPSRQWLLRIAPLGLEPTAPGGCVIHLLINARRPTAVTRILRLSAVTHEAAYLGLLDKGQRGDGGNSRHEWCQPDGRIWQVSRWFCCFCWRGCSKWQQHQAAQWWPAAYQQQRQLGRQRRLKVEKLPCEDIHLSKLHSLAWERITSWKRTEKGMEESYRCLGGTFCWYYFLLILP